MTDALELRQRYWGQEAAPIEHTGTAPLAVRAAALSLYGGAILDVVPQIYPEFTTGSRRGRSAAGQLSSNPVMFGPAWRLAFRMAALPIKVFKFTDEDGSREAAPGHPGYKLLRQPVPIEVPITRNILIGGTVLGMFAHKRVAWVKTRTRASAPPSELWPVPGHYLHPIRDRNSLLAGYEVRVPGVYPAVTLPLRDVCYFRLLPGMHDWADGTTPYQTLGTVGDLSDAAIQGLNDLFESGILGRWWVELPDVLEDPDQVKRLSAQFEGARKRRFGVPVLENAKLHSEQDQGTTEVMNSSLATAMNVIGHVFGFTAETDTKQFYAEAVQPVADAIEQELERSLFSEWPDQPAFAEFGFRETLKGTPAERIEMHGKAILTGQETINEARRDENKPPIPGGDAAFVPLNVIDIETASATQERPPAGSSGGLGGQEGKGTFPSAVQPETAPRAAEAGEKQPRARSARGQFVIANWSHFRTNTIRGQSGAMHRKMRGVMNKEQKALRKMVRPQGRSRAPGNYVDTMTWLPSYQDLQRIVAESEDEMARAMSQYMKQTADAAFKEAERLFYLENNEWRDRWDAVVDARTAVVTDRFGQARVGGVWRAINTATQDQLTPREASQRIADAYTGMADHLADGIARTESAWAYEQGAMAAWAMAGVETMDFVYGGGSCTTGVCEDAAQAGSYRIGDTMGDVGYSFEGADSPPLHPNCTCFTVPTILIEGRDATTLAELPPIASRIDRFTEYGNGMRSSLEEMFGRDSAWSGKLSSQDMSEAGAWGVKNWNCSISIDETLLNSTLQTDQHRFMVLLHEQYHAMSVALTKADYADGIRGLEEGVVEMMARLTREQVSNAMGMGYDWSVAERWNWAYNQYIEVLEVMRAETSMSAWDFYSNLISIPLREREAWLMDQAAEGFSKNIMTEGLKELRYIQEGRGIVLPIRAAARPAPNPLVMALLGSQTAEEIAAAQAAAVSYLKDNPDAEDGPAIRAAAEQAAMLRSALEEGGA